MTLALIVPHSTDRAKGTSTNDNSFNAMVTNKKKIKTLLQFKITVLIHFKM